MERQSNLLVIDENDLRRILTEVVEKATGRAVEDVREQANGYYNANEVCEVLHISKNTLYNYDRANLTHPLKCGTRKRLYRKLEIDNMINGRA